MGRGDTVNAFDPFGEEEDDFTSQGTDNARWSAEAWGNGANVSELNSTFDATSALFGFSGTSAAAADPFEARALFPNDPMGDTKKGPAVQVSVKEQLSCLYDEFSNTSSGRVEGSIYVRTGRKQEINPFCLVVRDSSRHLEKMHENPAVAHDITNNVTRQRPSSLKAEDRVFRITLPPSISPGDPIVTYVCDSSLRPIPMLVKTRVQVSNQLCDVGIRVRSNPSNKVPLTNLAILLAVPPDLNGETVKILEHAGIWDGMKRVIAWSVEQLDPGYLIELQCQFEFVVVPNDEESKRPAPKFPVLVRCDAMDEQLSDIELNTDYTDDLSSPVNMNLSRSVRILHRKV